MTNAPKNKRDRDSSKSKDQPKQAEPDHAGKKEQAQEAPDDIEEASMESFPASDPPSSHQAEPTDKELDAEEEDPS
jgi:hypothetical protein